MNNSETSKSTGPQKTWIEQIADKAEVPTQLVEGILDSLEIRATPKKPRNKRLRINGISFSGQKHGTSADSAFVFNWDDLGPGLWALLSDRNSRGKSTVLNIIRSALIGRFPGYIKGDVWSWIEALAVRFSIDNTEYAVEVVKAAGSTQEDADDDSPQPSVIAHAYLKRRDNDNWVTDYEGKVGDGFERIISDLFHGELSIEPISAYNKLRDSITSHRWPVVCSALFVSGPGKAIFGDETIDALPLRLMQTFIGLPWVSTYTTVSAKKKQFDAQRKKESDARTAEQKRSQDRINGLEQEKSDLQGQLKSLPDRRKLTDERFELEQRHRQHWQQQVAAEELHTKLGRKCSDLEDALKTAKHDQQQLADERSAGIIFRSLHPSICPSCETPISALTKEVDHDHVCGLCGHEHTDSEEDTTEALANVATEEINELQIVLQVSQKERDVAADALSKAISQNQLTARRIYEIDKALEDSKNGAVLETKLAAVTAVLEELRGSAPSDIDAGESDTVRVLQSAYDVTKAMMEGEQIELLTEISEVLTEYCRAFGVQNLNSMMLQPGGKLDVKQGDTDIVFSRMTPGERLRVRVAAALACVKVAKRRGYGRHPGLLILDSPGAQEMSAVDFEPLVNSLIKTVRDETDVQIIVSTVMRPELSQLVPDENRKHAKGEDFLF